MLHAAIDQFGAFLVVRGDDDETELAAENAPAWVGSEREWRADGSLWMTLACVDVPTREMIDTWIESVTERVGA